ncbi:MAG: hypothetical protein AAGH83_07320 [Pseudomonadota bacterium]
MSLDISRRGHRPPPDLTVTAGMDLRLSRVHEFCGPARRSLAVMVMARFQGPVIWIRPGWGGDRLHAEGVQPLADPGRCIFVDPIRPEDLLWCAEEALRAGAVPLVVAELPQPPALTPIRRLHLAAETGAERGGLHPLGLLLTPADGGAAGVESRWHIAGAHRPGHRPAWRLERRRARTAPVKSWEITVETLTKGPT